MSEWCDIHHKAKASTANYCADCDEDELDSCRAENRELVAQVAVLVEALKKIRDESLVFRCTGSDCGLVVRYEMTREGILRIPRKPKEGE